jgi:hypothetical protein
MKGWLVGRCMACRDRAGQRTTTRRMMLEPSRSPYAAISGGLPLGSASAISLPPSVIKTCARQLEVGSCVALVKQPSAGVDE